MLPVYRSQPSYGSSRGRKQEESGAWGLMMIVVFSGSCLVFTRQRSRSEQAALMPVAQDLPNLEWQQQQEIPDRAERVQLEADDAVREPAPTGFDPKLHAMYLDMPPLPEPTHEVLKVRETMPLILITT